MPPARGSSRRCPSTATASSPPVAGAGAPKASRAADEDKRQFALLGLAGTAGGVLAGFLGGLFYGFAGAAPGVGAISVLLVLLCLTTLLAALGAAGVAFGIAAATLVRKPGWQWTLAGGAFGGVLVGAFVKLLGLDAFNLLFGHSPGDMTGAFEGAILGAAVGLGFLLAGRQERLRVGVPLAALCGGGGGPAHPLARRPADGRQPRPARPALSGVAAAARRDVWRERFRPDQPKCHGRA